MLNIEKLTNEKLFRPRATSSTIKEDDVTEVA